MKKNWIKREMDAFVDTREYTAPTFMGVCSFCTVSWRLYLFVSERLYSCVMARMCLYSCVSISMRLYSCVMAHMCHGAYINFLLIYILMAQILIYICAMTHLHLCHDSWAPILMCHGTHVIQSRVTHCVWVSESLRLLCLNSNRADFLNTWIEREIDAVRHDSFICVTWPIHVCDMTHSYVSFISMTWLVCIWDWKFG